MKTMTTKNYTIVGLRHNDWQGDGLDARLQAAVGSRVVLMPDETNNWNHESTAAYIDTDMVGYVHNDWCRETTAYCNQSATGLLEGTVVGCDIKHYRLTVSLCVGGNLPATPDDTGIYEQWERNYRIIPLMGYTGSERRLQMLRSDLLMLLNGSRQSDGDLYRDLEVYEQLMGCDVSREAVDDRSRIVRLLQQSDHDLLRRWGDRLDVAVTTLGSPEARQQLSYFLFAELTDTKEFRHMVAHHRHIDLVQLEEQLRMFPHRLYDEYCLSKVDFASKLYYSRVPSRTLRYFLSGLLLLDQLRGSSAAVDQHQQAAVGDALQYVSRIRHCVASDWTGRIDALWKRLTAQYAQRFSETQAKNTTFNRRFTCQLVGTLLAQGVYRPDITQTEYTRLLEGSSRSSLRKDINQGVSNDAIRQSVRQLLNEKQ